MKFAKIIPAVILVLLLSTLISCKSDNKGIAFLVLDRQNAIRTISESTDSIIIDNYFKKDQDTDFRKLILEQSNGDNLIVEQKDKEGYLVIFKLGYEQFLITNQPQQVEELKVIMKKYLLLKDSISTEISFY